MASTSVNSSSPGIPVLGRWVRNEIYQSKLVNNNVDRIFDDFSESVQYPRIDLTQITWAARKAQYSWRRSAKPVVTWSAEQCRLPLLPDEVLLHIMQYLIPVQQSFHVFRYENDQGRWTTMIHRLCPCLVTNPETVDPIAGNIRPNMTALASVCRRLSELYHSIMYGENRFIFEVGPKAQWPRPTAKSQSGLHKVESWARAYETNNGTLWPLTQHTSNYAKDITLLITKSYQEASKLERILLTEQLSEIDQMLHRSANLNQLTVDMSTTIGPHEAVSQRLGWKLLGEDDHELRLRDVVNCPAACRDCPGFHSLWELLRDIKCKKEVVLSGHITNQLADEMRRVMLVE